MAKVLMLIQGGAGTVRNHTNVVRLLLNQRMNQLRDRAFPLRRLGAILFLEARRPYFRTTMSDKCETLYKTPKASSAKAVPEPWVTHKNNVHVLTLYKGLMVLEVWHDRDAKGFKISIEGCVKLFGKGTYPTLEVAKLEVIRKAKVQALRLYKQISVTLEATPIA